MCSSCPDGVLHAPKQIFGGFVVGLGLHFAVSVTVLDVRWLFNDSFVKFYLGFTVVLTSSMIHSRAMSNAAAVGTQTTGSTVIT